MSYSTMHYMVWGLIIACVGWVVGSLISETYERSRARTDWVCLSAQVKAARIRRRRVAALSALCVIVILFLATL